MTQMYQSLLNLSINARDAMKDNGVISFSSQVYNHNELQERFPHVNEQRYVCISVTDTGSGINEETLKKIFDPFFTTKEKGKGTGLGLAVVYGIVNNFGGFIDVQSALGTGTTFYLYFPLQEIAETQLEISLPPKLPDVLEKRDETILFVEDEEYMRDVVTKYLSTLGYTVLTANDGLEGVRMYREHQTEIDMVLSDMGLPRMEGGKMFEKMKEINPAVKLIFASGYLEPQLKTDLLSKGAKDFVDKPYQLHIVESKIRALLEEQ